MFSKYKNLFSDNREFDAFKAKEQEPTFSEDKERQPRAFEQKNISDLDSIKVGRVKITRRHLAVANNLLRRTTAIRVTTYGRQDEESR